jgi:hypothetical protein
MVCLVRYLALLLLTFLRLPLPLTLPFVHSTPSPQPSHDTLNRYIVATDCRRLTILLGGASTLSLRFPSLPSLPLMLIAPERVDW